MLFLPMILEIYLSKLLRYTYVFLKFNRKYSATGSNFTHSYMVTHRKPYGTYSFIAMDACPSPGLKRPFNFFGIMREVINFFYFIF